MRRSLVKLSGVIKSVTAMVTGCLKTNYSCHICSMRLKGVFSLVKYEKYGTLPIYCELNLIVSVCVVLITIFWAFYNILSHRQFLQFSCFCVFSSNVEHNLILYSPKISSFCIKNKPKIQKHENKKMWSKRIQWGLKFRTCSEFGWSIVVRFQSQPF